MVWLFDWLKRNLETIRVPLYMGAGVVTSVVSLVLQLEFQPIFVSSIFDIGFENQSQHILVKSTAGYLEPREDVKSCTLKIVMPFDVPPPAIDPIYICSWKGAPQDSLCYTDFNCEGIEQIHVLSVISPLFFMVGYLVLGGLLLWSRLLPHRKISRRVFILVSIFGAFLSLSGFFIVKLIPYITDFLLRTVFRKIRSVTLFKGGVNYLEFETIKYILHRRVIAARTLLDILAGFTVGLVFLIVERYREIQF